MKAYERTMAVAMVAVMVMSAMVCILPATEDSDAAIDNKTVNLSVWQTKISTISVNDTAFDFMKDGDGVKIAYKTGSGGYVDLYNYSITDGNGRWSPTATSEGAIDANLDGTGYNLSIESKSGSPDGEYNFYFTGTEAKTDQKLTIKITVTSQGAKQYLEYPFTINIYKAFTSDSKIIYGNAKGFVGETFSAGAPTVYYSYTDEENNDPVPSDPENNELGHFVFYATGFNTGVGLRDDLSIGGSVPEGLGGGWPQLSNDSVKGQMTLTFVVTDTRTGYMVTINNVIVGYTLTSGHVVDFDITYTAPSGDVNVNVGKYTWAETDGGTTATIVSNGSLKIIGADKNKATVVKTDDSGTTTTVETIDLTDNPQSISLPGTGTIEIIVSVDGVDEKKITFIVIDNMIPVNDIDVTCGPVGS